MHRKEANKAMSEEQIVALLRSEKYFEQGFRALVAAYQERLYWHIRRMVSYHEDADDVLQNALIKIYKGVSQFEGKSKLYTWLYRIATNEAITFIQNRQRRQSGSLDASGVISAAALQADAWFDGDAVQAKLQETIMQLPEKQRIVFNLRYFDEMPYEEMAEVLETSVGALKASFHHATKKIEAAFRE